MSSDVVSRAVSVSHLRLSAPGGCRLGHGFGPGFKRGHLRNRPEHFRGVRAERTMVWAEKTPASQTRRNDCSREQLTGAGPFRVCGLCLPEKSCAGLLQSGSGALPYGKGNGEPLSLPQSGSSADGKANTLQFRLCCRPQTSSENVSFRTPSTSQAQFRVRSSSSPAKRISYMIGGKNNRMRGKQTEQASRRAPQRKAKTC